MKKTAFTEIKPEDTRCPRILFHKRKHDSKILSSLKSFNFKGSLCSFDKIIHTSDEFTVSLKSL